MYIVVMNEAQLNSVQVGHGKDLELCASLLLDVGNSRTQNDLDEGDQQGRRVWGMGRRGTDLSGGKILSLERQLSRAVRAWTSLPDRGLYGISRLDRCGKPDTIVNERIWVVIPNCGHHRSSNESKCTQAVEDDTPEARCLANPGVYRNLFSAHAKHVL